MLEDITLINMTTNESIKVNQMDSMFVLTKADLGQVTSAHNSYKYPSQVGVYYSSTTLETRDINIEGWVIGLDHYEIERNKSVLNRMVNPTEELKIVREKYKLLFYPDSSVQYSQTISENNAYMCKFLIQGTANYPLFSANSDIESPITLTIPKFHFPLIIPKRTGIIMGIKQQQLIAQIDNIGDIETGLVVVLEAIGAVKNPSVTEILTQTHIWIDKDLSSGEIIRISTEDGNKYVKGYVDGNELNYFKYRRLESDWIRLKRGRNVFQYDCEQGKENLNVKIVYSPKYLEVD